jgi:hypothetical protein
LSRERGQHVGITFWGAWKTLQRLVLSFGWYSVSTVDIFQSLLIFLVSVIYLENFFLTAIRQSCWF